MITTGHYVAGRMVAGGEPATDVHDPSTGERIGCVPGASAELVDGVVAAAASAAAGWATTPLVERAEYLDRWREKIVAESDALLETTVDELGLPPAFARAVHIGRAGSCLIGLADLATSVLTPRTEAHSLVIREPAGVLAAITAWNFPLHQLISKVAGGLIMGNTVVVKPSEVKPLAAWRVTELLADVGLPAGVVNVINGRGADVGARLVAHREVDVISFTGSRATGRSILAASAATITRSVLELGGKNAALILPGVDLDVALGGVLSSCFFNNGQVCGAQSRLVVQREQLPEIEERVRAHLEAVVVGPARASGTTLGPVVTSGQQERVTAFVEHGIRSGLRTIAGGIGRPADVPLGGYYVRPTVFSDVPLDHPVAQEEIFGPVLTIHAAANINEMVRIANGTRYGLTGSVWSADLGQATAVARRLRAGQVQVNGGGFNLHVPYGGVRESGIGREHGLEGLAEFTEVKSLQLPA